MSAAEPTRSLRLRWKWTAALVIVALLAIVTVVWAISEPGSSSNDADCAIVEDVSRQWKAVSDQVQARPIREPRPDDYRSAAQLQTQMAEKLESAAHSVSASEISENLSKWAAAAERFADTQRTSAEQGQGGPEPSDVDEKLLQTTSSMNDAILALGELCPGVQSVWQ